VTPSGLETSPFNVRNIEGSRQKRHIELK